MKATTERDGTRSGIVFDTALGIGLAIFGVISRSGARSMWARQRWS
jgi:hypothetical protein